MLPNVGPAELLVILVLALLFFGPKKLPEIGKSIGNAMREFNKARSDFMDAVHHADHEPDEPPPPVKSIEYPTYPETPALGGSQNYEAMPYGADFYPADTVPHDAGTLDPGAPDGSAPVVNGQAGAEAASANGYPGGDADSPHAAMEKKTEPVGKRKR